MPYWNFEYTKAVIYTVVKVGGGTGQDPATEVTHLRPTSSFFQCVAQFFKQPARESNLPSIVPSISNTLITLETSNSCVQC